MEEKDIRKYAELMRELELTGLEIRGNGGSVRLERSVQPQPGSSGSTAYGEPVRQRGEEKKSTDAGCVDICSPMVGVFYSAPTESQEPFVKVGDRVRKGDVLCIIEAMKLMNELTADEDGVIAEVCAENNQVVDFGHVLFRLRREQG